MLKSNTAKRVDIDFNFFRSIPILEVADVLGVRVDESGKFCCVNPEHDDKHPSAQISRRNPCHWKCYSCGAGGSALDFVMHYQNLASVREAAFFLNEYFPGGIIEIEKEQDNNMELPYIPPEIMKEIGLKRDPFLTQRIPQKIGEVTVAKENETFELSRTEAAELVIDHLAQYMIDQDNYVKEVQSKFPLIGEDSLSYMYDVVREKKETAQMYLERMREYYVNLLMEEDKTIIPFQEELEEKEV